MKMCRIFAVVMVLFYVPNTSFGGFLDDLVKEIDNSVKEGNIKSTNEAINKILSSKIISDITPENLYPIFKLGSQNTNIQRENTLKRIKGKTVQWDLTVYEARKISDGKYKIQTSDGIDKVGTFIRLIARNQSEIDHIEGLLTGSKISVIGVIDDESMRNIVLDPAILFYSGMDTSLQGVKNEVQETQSSKPFVQQNDTSSKDKGFVESEHEKLKSGSSSVESSTPATPVHNVGDTFVTEVSNSDGKKPYSVERKIISVHPGEILVETRVVGGSASKTLEYTSEWNVISSSQGVVYQPAIKYFDFPLYPGKNWIGRSTETNVKTNAKREHTIKAIVGNWEYVTVPAGTFKAIKVTAETEVVDQANGQKITGTDTSWYAPEAHKTVKTESISHKPDGTEGRQIIQLINFKLNN